MALDVFLKTQASLNSMMLASALRGWEEVAWTLCAILG